MKKEMFLLGLFLMLVGCGGGGGGVNCKDPESYEKAIENATPEEAVEIIEKCTNELLGN